MHPAYSVISFTVTSGAGYGMFIALSSYIVMGIVPQDNFFYLCYSLIAILFISLGLFLSFLHLGRPERAWRAFLQWKSSWLSREGIAALVTYLPIAVLSIYIIFFNKSNSHILLISLSLITIVFCLMTLLCTGMIYQSLKTISQWRNRLVSPLYIIHSVTSGNICLILLLSYFSYYNKTIIIFSLFFLFLSLVLKTIYWNQIKLEGSIHTINDATGLGRGFSVSAFELPHSKRNYLQNEMGYHIARKHSNKLRKIYITLSYLLPFIMISLSFVINNLFLMIIFSVVFFSFFIGLFIERWLFFAEAEHTVMLYYGKKNN